MILEEKLQHEFSSPLKAFVSISTNRNFRSQSKSKNSDRSKSRDKGIKSRYWRAVTLSEYSWRIIGQLILIKIDWRRVLIPTMIRVKA